MLFEPLIENHSLDIKPNWAGFKIPYFTLEGKTNGFYRFRYLQTKPSKGFASKAEEPAKPQRYAQPPNSSCHIYLPPLTEIEAKWSSIAEQAEAHLIITEGELKAACGCACGMPTIGLGGVYSWRSAKQQQSFIPELTRFKWEGRKVHLVFDSDTATNPMVRAASTALAAELCARGALVRWVELPGYREGDDVVKQGMDDFIARAGSDAFKELLKEAAPIGGSVKLFELNQSVAFVHNTGEVVELDSGNVYSSGTFSDAVYRNQVYTEWKGDPVKPVQKAAAKEWLGWPYRNSVARLVYEPGSSVPITPNNEYNCWTGWAVQPQVTKGVNVQPWLDLTGRMFPTVDPLVLKYLRQWFAYPLQNPGAKLDTAVLVWGYQTGTGKTLLGETMGAIYGRNYGKVTNMQLQDKFTEWLVNKQFIVGDEISLAGKREVANQLKDIITRKTLRVNIKNQKTYEIRDCVNYYFTSNHPDAIYLEPNDRRFLVLEVNTEPWPHSEATRYVKWLEKEGGAAVLFHYLLHEVDCSDFAPNGRAPITSARHEMVSASASDAEDWTRLLKLTPDLATKTRFDLYTTLELIDEYEKEGQSDRPKGSIKAVGMGRALGAAGIFKVAHGNNTARVNGVRAQFWAVRNAHLYQRIGPSEAARLRQAEREKMDPKKFMVNKKEKVQ